MPKRRSSSADLLVEISTLVAAHTEELHSSWQAKNDALSARLDSKEEMSAENAGKEVLSLKIQNAVLQTLQDEHERCAMLVTIINQKVIEHLKMKPPKKKGS